MSTLHTRLRKLEAGHLCWVHRTRLVCAVCDLTGELTEAEWIELERLPDTIGLKEPEATGFPCGRCGQEALVCPHCDSLSKTQKAAHDALSGDDRAHLHRLVVKLAGGTPWLT
jgi:hypothetical protein